MEKERSFLERVKLQTVDRARNEVVLALEDWVERDVNPPPPKIEKPVDRIRRKLVFGGATIVAGVPLLLSALPREEKLPELITIEESRVARVQNLYFFNETPGLVLQVVPEAALDFYRSIPITSRLPENFKIFFVILPMELNEASEEQFNEFFRNRLKRLNLPPKGVVTSTFVFLDSIIAKRLLQDSPGSNLRAGVSENLSLAWAQTVRESTATSQPVVLTNDEIRRTKIRPSIRVVELPQDLVEMVRTRYTVKVGPEVSRPQTIDYREVRRSPHGVIWNEIPGLKLKFADQDALERLINDPELGIRKISYDRKLVTVLVLRSQGMISQELVKNYLAKFFPDQEISHQVVNFQLDKPIRETIKAMPASGVPSDYELVELSRAISFGWIELMRTFGEEKLGPTDQLERLNERQRRIVTDNLPIEVQVVDTSLLEQVFGQPEGTETP